MSGGTSCRRAARLLASCTAFLAAAVLWPVAATQVRSLDLEQMTARADRVVSGTVLSVDDVVHPGVDLPVALVRIAVERAAKGSVGPVLEFRTLAFDDDNGADVPDLPRFEPGERVVLFLYPDGPSGLTSPVGFGQGKFRVVETKTGPVAVNAFRNRNLTGIDGARTLTPNRLLDLARARRAP